MGEIQLLKKGEITISMSRKINFPEIALIFFNDGLKKKPNTLTHLSWYVAITSATAQRFLKANFFVKVSFTPHGNASNRARFQACDHVLKNYTLNPF